MSRPTRIYVEGKENAKAVAGILKFDGDYYVEESGHLRKAEIVFLEAYRAGIEVCEVERIGNYFPVELDIKSTRKIGGKGDE